MNAGSVVKGVRVLIVEDEFLLAVALEEDLKDAGFQTVGPFNSLARALAALDTETFDLAVVDVNLGSEMAYPLLDALIARGVPALMLSGYGPGALPERFRAMPRIAKPAPAGAVVAALAQLSK